MGELQTSSNPSSTGVPYVPRYCIINSLEYCRRRVSSAKDQRLATTSAPRSASSPLFACLIGAGKASDDEKMQESEKSSLVELHVLHTTS